MQQENIQQFKTVFNFISEIEIIKYDTKISRKEKKDKINEIKTNKIKEITNSFDKINKEINNLTEIIKNEINNSINELKNKIKFLIENYCEERINEKMDLKKERNDFR